MSHKIICLLCLYLSFQTMAQDTICKRTGECFAAKVLEIGITDVKFRRADNLDGPLFIYNKSDIRKIKYASGAVDTFALVKETPRPAYLNKALPGFDNNKVVPSGRLCLFMYHGKTISDHRLVTMALDGNETWKDKELAGEVRKTRNFKTYQYVAGFGGIGLGLIAFGTTSTYSGSNLGVTAGALLLSTGLVIASEIFSVRFKMQRGAHARRVAELYNAHLN